MQKVTKDQGKRECSAALPCHRTTVLIYLLFNSNDYTASNSLDFAPFASRQKEIEFSRKKAEN
jgi:hypothetical protein